MLWTEDFNKYSHYTVQSLPNITPTNMKTLQWVFQIASQQEFFSESELVYS